jgi:WD40 repeat protein
MVLLHTLTGATPLIEIPASEVNPVSVQISSGQNLITMINADAGLEFRDSNSGELLKSLTTGADSPDAIAISRNGEIVTAAVRESLSATTTRLLTWNVRSGGDAGTPVDVPGQITPLAFVRDDDHLLCIDRTVSTPAIVTWNIDPGREAGRVKLPAGEITTHAVHPDGTAVALAGADGNVLVLALDAESAASAGDAVVVPVPAVSMAFHPHEPWLVIGTNEGKTVLWNLADRAIAAELSGADSEIRAVAVDSTGRRVAVASGDEVRVWDMTLRYVRILIRIPRPISLAFRSDGGRLAVVTEHDGLRLIDTTFDSLQLDPDGWLARVELLMTPSNYDEFQAALPVAANYDPRQAVTTDGRLTVVGRSDTPVVLQDFRTGEELHQFSGGLKALSVAVSPDARYAATGSFDRNEGMGDVRLWNLRSGREIRKFLGHVHYAWSVAFSPDGSRLLSGGNQTMHLWNVETGEEIRRMMVRFAFVRRVTFSPDGRWGVASDDLPQKAGVDHIVFDLATGEPLMQFEGSYPELSFAPPRILCDTRFGTFTLTVPADDSKSGS